MTDTVERTPPRAPERAYAAPAHRRPLRFGHHLLPFIDQAAVSVGNFATGVVLARQLDQAAFGVWVLANIVVWFVLELQRGLMLNPIAVNGAALGEAAFRRFLAASVLLNGAFILAVTLLAAAFATAWTPLRPMALPLATALLFWQTQELCRRVLYTRLRMPAALVNNIINYDLQLLPLVVAAVAGVLDLATGLWIVALTSALATLVGIWQLRDLATRELADVRAVARANFHLGKWTGASAVLAAAGFQWYPALVSALVGVSSAAVLGVVLQLLSPVNLLLRPLQSYWTPLAVRALAHDGSAGLSRVVRRAALVTGVGYLAYTLAVALAPEQVLRLLYAGRYVEDAPLVAAFALLNVVFLPVHILILEVIARRQQHAQFWAELWAVVVTYSLGVYLIGRFGVLGAGFTLAACGLGQLAYFATLVGRLRRAAARAPGRI